MPSINRTTDSLVLKQQDARGISEITILPDGRVYVLGLSKAVLAVMQTVGLAAEAPAEHPECGEKRAPKPGTETSA